MTYLVGPMAGKRDPSTLFSHCALKESCKETIVVVLVSLHFRKVIDAQPIKSCKILQDWADIGY